MGLNRDICKDNIPTESRPILRHEKAVAKSCRHKKRKRIGLIQRVPAKRLHLHIFKRMYLSNTAVLTSLSRPLNEVFHVLRGPVQQDAGTPLLLLMQIFNLSIISIAVHIENVSPTQGYRKEPPFPQDCYIFVRQGVKNAICNFVENAVCNSPAV
jgi:hypothetical protein